MKLAPDGLRNLTDVCLRYLTDVCLRYQDLGISAPIGEDAVPIELDRLTVYGLGRVTSTTNPSIVVQYWSTEVKKKKPSIFEAAPSHQVEFKKPLSISRIICKLTSCARACTSQ